MIMSLFMCLIFVIITSCLTSTKAKLNLYVNKDEVQTLLGLNAEIYYVRYGIVNDYALKFVVTVPAEISELHFTWISLVSPMPYSIGLSVSDVIALETPIINITRVGNVPLKEQVFRVSLPCTGRVNAEVEVQIFINITMSASSNVTALTLKRKKICLKSDINHISVAQDININKEKEIEEEETLLADTSSTLALTSPLYIAVACASGIILVLAFLALLCYVCYVKSQKERQTQTGNFTGSLTNLSSSKSGQAFLRVETPNNVIISKTGSHYSSFRGLLTVPPPSLYRTLSVPVHIMNSEHNRVSKLSEQIAELAVERRKILLQEKIREGTFGQIYSGIYIGDQNEMSGEQKVMIKTVSDQASKLQVSLVLTEGMKFWSLNHRNILSIIATCTDDPQRPLLIYPFMNGGNLKLFLQKSSAHKFSNEGQVHTFLTQDLVQMAIQIASAVIYLHKRRIIHRDLATRNCVVSTLEDGAFLVKLTDNALSRDLFPNDYHCLGDNENRPIKWLSLESLLKKEFTQSSDVWSYGVTIWELMTLGNQPYLEVDPFEMAAYLRDGYRLFQPINCPDKLYDIMVCCWNIMPDARPTFPQLLSCLDDFYQTLGKYI